MNDYPKSLVDSQWFGLILRQLMVEAYHLVASQLDYSLYSADYIDYILGLQLFLSSKRQLSCNIQHILTELVELQQTQISHVVAGSLVQHLKADVIIHL